MPRAQGRDPQSGGKPPSSEGRTRFVVDAMLGSLARKLRALGFDTDYYKTGDDAGLVRLAAGTARIIITSDRSLVSVARSRGARAILVVGRNDRERIRSLAQGAALSRIPLSRGDPLCSICGGELIAVSKKGVAGAVPPSVERRHRLFFRCASCGQLYWRGSHWKRLMSLAGRLGRTQNAATD